ncbi:hypothetical protein SAMN05421770_101514 [Granulicella rosea]|uniref:Uncharacterized protein n=1 Tax=Granulicella rosea TaxID=474952 RepID=A0A239DM53_9BACT|nr:hypothetical protein [Granulicella rosea]SNS32744.1 hypothetical protein SAMN05421770_101514 [Granulicella rosea]
MNVSMRRLIRHGFPPLVLLLGSAAGARAQVNSTTATVALTATLSEAVTVSVTPTAMTFALVAGGTANGSVPVAVTTTWVTATSRANLVLDAYFTTASAALTTAGPPVVNIPSSEVLGQMTTGTPTSYTAFTQTAAFGPTGGGLTLYTVALTSSNRSGTRTDNLTLQINLTGTQIPAATYTGTMYLQAQAL